MKKYCLRIGRRVLIVMAMYSPTPNPSEVHAPLKIYPVTEMYFGELFIDILNNIRACKGDLVSIRVTTSGLGGCKYSCNGCASKHVNFL